MNTQGIGHELDRREHRLVRVYTMQACFFFFLMALLFRLTAWSSSFQILMVLSASPVIRRSPVLSNSAQKIPASLSNDPGCTSESSLWNWYPDFQSQKPMAPLSAIRKKRKEKSHPWYVKSSEASINGQSDLAPRA